MANSADPDQLASSEANWSGSALFGKAGHTRVQQEKVTLSTFWIAKDSKFLHVDNADWLDYQMHMMSFY